LVELITVLVSGFFMLSMWKEYTSHSKKWHSVHMWHYEVCWYICDMEGTLKLFTKDAGILCVTCR